jgi:site-specific DNA-methyltransferase (adenine-specific)
MKSLEPNQVYLGDSLEMMDRVPEGSADLILTDPPYGISFRSNHPREGARKIAIANDGAPYYGILLRKIGTQASDTLKRGGLLIMFASGGSHMPRLRQAMDELDGFGDITLERLIPWDKDMPCMGTLFGYRPSWESILVFTKGPKRAYWSGDQSSRDLLRTLPKIPKEGEHPTPKPSDLLGKLIVDNCPPSGLVLDPFCGEGPTLVAAIRTGRSFIGIEIEPTWHARAQSAVDRELKQERLPFLRQMAVKEELI